MQKLNIESQSKCFNYISKASVLIVYSWKKIKRWCFHVIPMNKKLKDCHWVQEVKLAWEIPSFYTGMPRIEFHCSFWCTILLIQQEAPGPHPWTPQWISCPLSLACLKLGCCRYLANYPADKRFSIFPLCDFQINVCKAKTNSY